MKTKPILFRTPMVEAILEGRKTQTRRIIKSIPKDTYKIWFDGGEWIVQNEKNRCWTGKLEPKYKKDDILWIRETFMNHTIYGYIYKAAGNPGFNNFDILKWKPSIFMPKEAARIFLKVTNVRVERLHDISESDAIAEGVGAGFQMNAGYPDYEHIVNGVCTLTQDSAYASFISLWQKINGNWNENPFVWVYEFERIEKPENFIYFFVNLQKIVLVLTKFNIMGMFYILFSIAFLLSLGLNLYFWVSKQDLSIESGLNRLKTSLIRMIVFYQDKYNGSDQLVFMAKWIQQVKDKIKSAPAHEKDLFKEIVNGL